MRVSGWPNLTGLPPKPRKRRQGGCLQGLILLAVLGVIVSFGWFGLTNPWIFTVGGKRYVPLWQGMARSEGPGGEYRLYVAFYPTGASTAKPSTWAEGWGIICAPAGHSYRLHVRAATDSVVWKDMNGQPFHLYAYGSNSFAGLNRGELGPPSIDFRGKWAGAHLEMSDGGTIGAAFRPDGTLAGPASGRAPARRMVFSETSWVLSNPCE